MGTKKYYLGVSCPLRGNGKILHGKPKILHGHSRRIKKDSFKMSAKPHRKRDYGVCLQMPVSFHGDYMGNGKYYMGTKKYYLGVS